MSVNGDRDRRFERQTDVDNEIRYHLERTTEEFIAAGYEAGEARRRALERFGDLSLYRSRLTGMQKAGAMMRLREALERTTEDIRFGIRYALRNVGLTVGVAVTLALGVGANATMYSVIDRILLTPPPHIQDAGRVKRILVERAFLGTKFLGTTFTHPDFLDWQSASAFSAVTAITQETETLGTGENAQRLPSVYVTHDFFPLLGTPPHRGRIFDQDDDVPGAEPVAIIGYDFWLREFGGQDDAVGAVLDLGHARYRVVGVAPRGFTGVDLDRVDLWLPLFTHSDVASWSDSRGYYFLHAFARLAPGIDEQTAAAEATLLHRNGRLADPDYDHEANVLVSPLLMARGPRASNESRVARWLTGVSLFVLIIACSNVANLLLAHGARQQRDISVRLALGVSRARMVRQMLWSGLVFGVLGASGAVAIAHWGGVLVGRVLLPDVDWSAGVVTPRILIFTTIVALIASIVATMIPAIRSSRGDLISGLKQGGRGGSTRRSRLRWSLLAAQAALSTVLLVGSGLFVKSLRHVEGEDLGFDPDHVYVVRLELPSGTGGETSAQSHARALERIQQAPFVQGAGVTTAVPLSNSMSLNLRASGRDEMPVGPGGGAYVYAVSPDFLHVLDIQLVRGRGITTNDVRGAPYVTVINQTMGHMVWPNQDPIGQCLFILEPRLHGEAHQGDPPCTEVVGIVEDAHRQSVVEEGQDMLYYLPSAQYNITPRGLMVLSSMPQDQAIPALKALVFDAVPEARYVRIEPMTTLVDPDFRAWRLGASVFTAFGILALIVAAVGLYSVLAFDVAQRRGEIGVRSALGATAPRLVRWIVAEGIGLVAGGVLFGSLIALVGAGAIQSLLYETSARDPLILFSVAGVLVLVAIVASLVPALRTTRVQPIEALRVD